MAHLRSLLTLAFVSSFALVAPSVRAQGAVHSTAASAVTYQPYAQREAGHYDGPPLLLGRRIAIGGYGGLTAGYTRMLNRDGGLVGFEGALLLAHKLSLGFAGYGFARDPAGPADLDGRKRDFGVGYGGLQVRYAPFTSWPVYPAIGLLIGGGAVNLNHEDDHDEDHAQIDGFFVAQPELTAHANLTRWMRLGVNAGYRITSGVNRFGLKESDLNGVVLGGHVQFGWL